MLCGMHIHIYNIEDRIVIGYFFLLMSHIKKYSVFIFNVTFQFQKEKLSALLCAYNKMPICIEKWFFEQEAINGFRLVLFEQEASWEHRIIHGSFCTACWGLLISNTLKMACQTRVLEKNRSQASSWTWAFSFSQIFHALWTSNFILSKYIWFWFLKIIPCSLSIFSATNFFL